MKEGERANKSAKRKKKERKKKQETSSTLLSPGTSFVQYARFSRRLSLSPPVTLILRIAVIVYIELREYESMPVATFDVKTNDPIDVDGACSASYHYATVGLSPSQRIRCPRCMSCAYQREHRNM